jgi:hypothetical protein
MKIKGGTPLDAMAMHQIALVETCADMLAALMHVRDCYLSADPAWRFSEDFDIGTVCRAIAKAEQQLVDSEGRGEGGDAALFEVSA